MPESTICGIMIFSFASIGRFGHDASIHRRMLFLGTLLNANSAARRTSAWAQNKVRELRSAFLQAAPISSPRMLEIGVLLENFEKRAIFIRGVLGCAKKIVLWLRG